MNCIYHNFNKKQQFRRQIGAEHEILGKLFCSIVAYKVPKKSNMI